MAADGKFYDAIFTPPMWSRIDEEGKQFPFLR